MLKQYRLFTTMAGLALMAVLGFASLSNTAAITSTSLQIPIPSRDELISTIFDPTPLFTASGEQIIFDADKLIFLSTSGGTFAFLPLHPAYQPRLIELYKSWQEFENVAVPLGGLYVVEPIKVVKGMHNEGPEFSLPKGAYLLKLAPVDPKGDVLRVAIVNGEGQVVGHVTGDIQLVAQPQLLKSRPFIRTKQVGDFMLAEIEIPWMMPSTINTMSLDSIALGPIADFLSGLAAGVTVAMAILML